jgi:hypothetical protein
MMSPFFMRAIDRVHAARQLLAAFSEQMGWADIDLFFRRMRILVWPTGPLCRCARIPLIENAQESNKLVKALM